MSEEIKETEAAKEEEVKAAETTEAAESSETVTEEPEKKAAAKKKKPFLNENSIEIMVAVLLGITALLTAWATWIGSLHGGNQATNYTRSNNLASEGNSEYNAGIQLYLSDLMAWNTITDYSFEGVIAESEGDDVKAKLIDEKIDKFAEENGSTILVEGIEWMNENDAKSPFDMPGIMDKYLEDANKLLDESRQLLEEGKRDNARGDTYNLVNVIYSVVLFMLGIVGIFKKLPNRFALLIIAAVVLVLATAFMCTIPLPTGFNLASFFGPK